MTRPHFRNLEIKQEDNKQIARINRDTLVEKRQTKLGTYLEDFSIYALFEYLDHKKACYYILELEGHIVGGAGISQLENYAGPICELQKMYFKPEARGLGLGKIMMDHCLKKAKTLGYEKCYLETMPYMKGARKLYRKVGFTDLDSPVGDTGHHACSRWMIKKL